MDMLTMPGKQFKKPSTCSIERTRPEACLNLGNIER
jgi:hypothetical protein